jgi:hypothetical protein
LALLELELDDEEAAGFDSAGFLAPSDLALSDLAPSDLALSDFALSDFFAPSEDDEETDELDPARESVR